MEGKVPRLLRQKKENMKHHLGDLKSISELHNGNSSGSYWLIKTNTACPKGAQCMRRIYKQEKSNTVNDKYYIMTFVISSESLSLK